MNTDWQQWIDKVENEEVTEQEFREFRAAIENSPAQMDEYLEALMVETSLDLKAGLKVAFLSYEDQSSGLLEVSMHFRF